MLVKGATERIVVAQSFLKLWSLYIAFVMVPIFFIPHYWSINIRFTLHQNDAKCNIETSYTTKVHYPFVLIDISTKYMAVYIRNAACHPGVGVVYWRKLAIFQSCIL